MPTTFLGRYSSSTVFSNRSTFVRFSVSNNTFSCLTKYDTEEKHTKCYEVKKDMFVKSVSCWTEKTVNTTKGEKYIVSIDNKFKIISISRATEEQTMKNPIDFKKPSLTCKIVKIDDTTKPEREELVDHQANKLLRMAKQEQRKKQAEEEKESYINIIRKWGRFREDETTWNALVLRMGCKSLNWAITAMDEFRNKYGDDEYNLHLKNHLPEDYVPWNKA